MFGKKKKGDLGDVVFPEFPELKPSEKKLPPLEIPQFKKDGQKFQKEFKPGKLELPELKLPSFASLKKPEDISNEIKKAVKQEQKSLPPPAVKPGISKFAPPHESSMKEQVQTKKIEVKKPASPMMKPAVTMMKREQPRTTIPAVRQPHPIQKPKMQPVIATERPKPVTKLELPKPEIKHISQFHKFIPFKPLIIKQKPIVKQHRIAHVSIRKPSPIHHVKPKAHAIHHKLKAHPIHAKLKHHHAPKIPKIKHLRFKKQKIKPIIRALKHVIIRGPAKPKDRLTLKRLSHHVADIAKDLQHLRSEVVKDDSFGSLKNAVEKEVASIRKLYKQFDYVQRDFKKTQLSFAKAKREFNEDVNKARKNLKEDFDSARMHLNNEVTSAKKLIHSNYESVKSNTSREVLAEKREIRSEIDSFKKSITAKQDENMKMITGKQDDMLKKVNVKLIKMTAENDELMKDLGKLTILDSKLSEKLDVSVYNQLVRKINELETNTAANETQLDNDLRSTIGYVKKLGEAFDNSVKIREAIKERLLYHENAIKEIYSMIRNKPKVDFTQYIEEYASQPSPQAENSREEQYIPSQEEPEEAIAVNEEEVKQDF